MPKKKAAKKTSEEPSLPSLALVFGYIAVKELQRTEDRVAVLSRLGYGNREMAIICDTTPAVVATLKQLQHQQIADASARRADDDAIGVLQRHR